MHTLKALIGFSLLFGLCSGGLLPLGAACVAKTTSEPAHAGLRIGIMMSICSIGALSGGPIGAILQAKNGSESMQHFAAYMSLLGSVLVLATKPLFTRNVLGRF